MAQTAYADALIRRGSSSLFKDAPKTENTAATGSVYTDDALGRFNKNFGKSTLGKYFDLEGRNTTLTNEVRAGCVGFLTIAYIIAVNPAILADTGGPCSPADCTGPNKGTDACKFDNDPGYSECVLLVKQSLVAATCISAACGCFMMAFLANMPLCVAPGMGINAYFTYQVVGYHGSGGISYQTALTAVFLESLIFLFISLTGLRGRMIELVPTHIMLATAVGIGLFLSHIGFQQAEGIGLITFDPATLVSLGGCPPSGRARMYTVSNTSEVCTIDPTTGEPAATGLGPQSANYQCVSQKMRSPTMWLGIWSGVLIVILMYYNIKAAIMYGVLFATIISWIPGSSVSYLTDATPGGAERFETFKQVVAVPNPSKTAMQLDFSDVFTSADAWVALITFLYLDFLDATGTLFTMARLINDNVPGFIDDKARFPRRLITLCVDGVAILIGSLLGTSPLTVVAESSVGIKEGGRTGVTAFVLGMGFTIAMFFSPLFSSIPGYATGPALIIVGTLMMGNACDIDWDRIEIAFPAFLTIALMPLTYSIAYGVLTGILSNITMWLVLGIINMGIAGFGKDPLGRTPGRVFYEMFECWRSAFENFVPGVKAEWRGVFSNKVIRAEDLEDAHDVDLATKQASIAYGNGDFGHLAVSEPKLVVGSDGSMMRGVRAQSRIMQSSALQEVKPKDVAP